MQVYITTIIYLRIFIIQIGSTLLLIEVEPQGRVAMYTVAVCLSSAKTYVLPATAPEAGPRDLQKAWQAQQKTQFRAPRAPPQLYAPYPLHGARRLFLVIYCYHQHNPKSKPEKPASDALDSQLQANLRNPRNPTPKP